MTEILKISVLCLISAFLAVLLQGHKKEYSFLLSVAAAVTVFYSVLSKLTGPILGFLETVKNSGTDISYINICLKALGIGYITEFIADTCRDFGQSSVAAKAELLGKCAVLLLCIPVLKQILELLNSLV